MGHISGTSLDRSGLGGHQQMKTTRFGKAGKKENTSIDLKERSEWNYHQWTDFLLAALPGHTMFPSVKYTFQIPPV